MPYQGGGGKSTTAWTVVYTDGRQPRKELRTPLVRPRSAPEGAGVLGGQAGGEPDLYPHALPGHIKAGRITTAWQPTLPTIGCRG